MKRGNVFLIGFMGSGKSAVGKKLAAGLGLPFIDTDREIAKTAGCSITALFRRCGEDDFRRREAASVARACRKSKTVVSVGGGAVLRRENIAAMRRAGTVVYLQAPLAVLRRRVGAGGSRPLWGQAGRLYALRLPLYNRAAHFRVRAGEGSPAAVARRIAGRLS